MNKILIMAISLTSTLLFYQNCGKILTDSSSNQQADSPRCTSGPNCLTNPDTRLPQTAPPATNSTFSFSSSSEFGCELEIANHIRRLVPSGVLVLKRNYCQIGGRCGNTCGKPNGNSCLSSQPTQMGACLNQAEIDENVKLSLDIFNNPIGFNFVSGDQLGCFTSINERFWIATGKLFDNSDTCKIGEGCGANGCNPKTDQNCVSANPQAYGACFTYNEFKNSKSKPAP